MLGMGVARLADGGLELVHGRCGEQVSDTETRVRSDALYAGDTY